MAEPGEELLEGDLGEGDYNELDADEEEALLADDNGYAGYNLPVTTHRDVYISTSPDDKSSRNIKVEDVEDVAEGDEILDNEDVLELGVDGNWNLDDLDSESQDQKRNSERKPSHFHLWIKQERVDSAEFSHSNEPEEDEDQKSTFSSENRKSTFITSSADVSQSHLQDDDDEDDHERRDRFTSERSLPGIISLKTPDSKWGTIPDSLDSVITANPPNVPAHKSSRGRGVGGTPGRRGGGRGGLRQQQQQQQQQPPPSPQDAPHHKVLINPHFKGGTPTPSQFPQTQPGNIYRGVQHAQHFDHSEHQYQKQPEYQQYQPQYPPHSHPQYQESPDLHRNAPHGPHPTSGQGPHYQNDWQNPAGGPPHHYEQHNHPGYYEEAPAPPPPAWIPPGQPVYQDYNQHPQPPHPHPHPPHHQSPHRPPLPPPPPHPHPGPVMRPPVPQSIHHIVSQQQPPPPGLEAEFHPRKVQFSNENKIITVQMYSESAPGGGGGDDVTGSPAHNQFGNKMGPQTPDHYLNQPPGPFPNQGGPPRPPHFSPQPFRPPAMFGVPQQQPSPRMFPPPPQNQSPRFSPRFKRGAFQRGGFPPQFRHPLGPRTMPPGAPSPRAIFSPRLPNYQQSIKRPHPELQVPHQQPPFKQMRPNPNCPEVQLGGNKAIKPAVQRNLLEVQTVDNVPDTTTFSDQGVEEEFDEDDDEETREYKRKIAEQKRLRAKLLQEKEERRKLAAAAKQKELEDRKVAGQNVPNSQVSNPAYSESSQQPTVASANEGSSRVSVHQRIGIKPVGQGQGQFPPGSTQVTVYNQQQQPTAFKIVRVRTKDGTVLIKKLPINSAGQVMIQRPVHLPGPPNVVHHQPVPARQFLQQMNPLPPHPHPHPPPPPPPHHHHQQPPHHHPDPSQHQPMYPQPPAPPHPAPHYAPPPPQQHNQFFHPQPNPPPQPPYQQPQIVQQPFYQQQTHQAPQPPQIIHQQNPVSVVNSKRIVVDRPQMKPIFHNRSRVRPMIKKTNASSNNSSVITIVPVNKNMTLGQRFTIQNQQVKKGQVKKELNVQVKKEPPQAQKIPVQAQSGTKPNRTVINTVLNAGAPTIKMPLPPGPVTSKVVVDNLTAGTSRQQLVSMAEQVGEVKILTLDTSQKRASITFNNIKAATAFYQRFQRKMVNLSMINVSFVPE